MAAIAEAARLSRQEALIPAGLQDAVCIVVGAGMLGGFTAIALAKCAAHVAVYDFDDVEDVNTGNQPYHAMSVGRPKVDALGDLVAGLPVSMNAMRFEYEATPEDIFGGAGLPATAEPRPLVVISAADDFAVRGAMANWARVRGAAIFVDTRALQNMGIVFLCPGEEYITKYLSEELDEEMIRNAPEGACDEKGTAYVGMSVASRVVAGLAAFFRGAPVNFVSVQDVVLGITTRQERAHYETVR